MTTRISCSLAMWCVLSGVCFAEQQCDMLGHWRLAGDCRDDSGRNHHGVNHGADLTAADAASFDGIDDFIEVAATDALHLGKQDFSIAVWVHTEADLSDVLGDILSQYAPATRTGFTLSLLNYAGVTSSQSNYRNVSFGIDAGRVDPAWTDRGRPGNARFVMAMAVFQGKLFAGTLPSGHVFSLEAGKCVTHDRELAPGWRHIAAVKAGGLLKLYIDGQCTAQSARFDPAEYDLSTPSPLRIGFGQHDYFRGRMKDLRLYPRALGEAEIRGLVSAQEPANGPSPKAGP